MPLNWLKSLALSCGFMFTALALWALASGLGWVNAFLLPSPARVASSFVTLLENGKLMAHTGVSLWRVAVGYALAVGLALVLSLGMLGSKALSAFLEPPIEFLRQVPPLALVPLMMLWLGIGQAQKLSIIMLACFFPIFLGFRGGFAQVDPKLIDVGRAAGFSRFELMRRIAVPGALPSIIVGLRLGLGYGWRALVGAELVASSAGLGYMILDAQDLARTDVVMVGVLVIGSIGLLTDWGLKTLVRRKLPWMREQLELGRG